MARLVDVVRGAGGEHKACAGERNSQLTEIPLVIESRLTLSLALPEASLASSGGGAGGCGGCGGGSGGGDLDVFLSRYRTLSKAEVKSSLAVTKEEVASTVTGLVTCLGCRSVTQ